MANERFDDQCANRSLGGGGAEKAPTRQDLQQGLLYRFFVSYDPTSVRRSKGKQVSNLGESIRGSRHDERSLRKPPAWMELFHNAYVIGALVAVGAGFFKDASTKEWILLVTMSVYVLVAVVFAGWSSFTLGAKARYAEAAGHLHSGMHVLRNLRVLADAASFYQHDGDERVRAQLERCLSSFRACLEMVTSTAVECRIECLEDNGGGGIGSIYSYPLAADAETATRRAHMMRAACAAPYSLAATTPYMLLYDRGENFYFCGDLVRQQDYRTGYKTAFPGEAHPRSTIVWPIRYKRGRGKKDELVGFLHAESSSKKAFNRRYDVELGAVFADSLFDIIFKHLRSSKNAHARLVH